MKQMDFYESGELASVIKVLEEAASNEPRFGGAVIVVPSERDGYFNMKLNNLETGKEFELATYLDEKSYSLAFSYEFSETEKFMGRLYFRSIERDYFSEAVEYIGMRYTSPDFTRRDIENLNAFLGKELGFPVAFMTEKKMKEIDCDYVSYIPEDISFSRRYYSLESYLKADLGIFSRIYRKGTVFLSANDGFGPTNLLHFSVSLSVKYYEGGGNSVSFPLLSTKRGFHFNKETRTWHLNL